MNMIFKFSRHRAMPALFALAVVLLTARLTRADRGDSREVDAQRLVHILGYTAADYGGAVAEGKVTNESEYQEQLALLDDAAKIGARLGGAPSAGAGPLDLPTEIRKVRALVEAKAPEADVASAIEPIRTAIIGGFKLAEAPTSAPSVMRGRALYVEHCTTCHGATGKGDTARAATLTPRPANFHDPEIGGTLTPFRIASTVRFGVNNTAMVPFTFLSDAERWDLAFFVAGLRHADVALATGAPTYALGELATRSDAQLAADLTAAGVGEDRVAGTIADLRRRAPYEDRAARSPLGLARTKLDRARVAIARGDRDGARGLVIDAYLEGVEPAEAALRATDPALSRAIEARFMELRGRLQSGAPTPQLLADLASILGDVTRAEGILAGGAAAEGFTSAAFKGAMILLREGTEAALLIAALLGLAAQAGLADKKRWVHAGWATALVLGALTWVVSSQVITLSGASREVIEGVTALLATLVLFYVSYSLIAKREVARWMKFLRARVSPARAAVSLFGISLLAAYREVFETVLFYQGLLATARAGPVLVGVAAGALALVALVVVYTRAGRFAPPQIFFQVSSYLLYGLAVVFAGQGIAALQTAGVLIATISADGRELTLASCGYIQP